MAFIGIVVMVIGLFAIPIGLPGLWIMIAVIAAGAISGKIGLLVLIGGVMLAVIAELLEFVLVKRFSTRYGGSRKAFWGALAGGLVGVVVGVPIPVIGSIIAGFIGTFAGAAIVTWFETKEFAAAGRVGWGVVLGRAFAAVAKMTAGIIILVLGAAGLLIG